MMNPQHELTTVPADGDSLLRSVAGLPALYGANDSLAYYRETTSVVEVQQEAGKPDEKSTLDKIKGLPDWNWGRALLGVDAIESLFKRTIVGVVGIVAVGVGLYVLAKE